MKKFEEAILEPIVFSEKDIITASTFSTVGDYSEENGWSLISNSQSVNKADIYGE